MISSPKARAHISFSAAQRRVLAVFLCLAMVGASAMITFGSSLFPSAEATAQAETVFGSSVPAVPSEADSRPVDVATRLKVTTAGKITAIRFYKSAQNTGVHTGLIWGTGGHVHASVTFKNETASGWQVATLSTPMSLNAGTTIIVSYHAPVGHYADDANYFAGKGAGAGHIQAQPDVTSKPDALYHYGTTPAFPTSTWKSSNYYVDAVFVPKTAGVPVSPPPTAAPTTAAPTTAAPTTAPPTTTQVTTPPPTTPPPTGADPCALNQAAQSCWAAHTGVPGFSEAQILAGQSNLTHVVGDITVTTPGTVIDHEWIDGCIAVKASNVTISNSLVRSAGTCKGGNLQSAGGVIDTGGYNGSASAVTNLMIKDTEIDGMKPNHDAIAIGGTAITCLRCNVHGRAKGAYLDSNSTIQDSYFHDNDAPGTVHLDGIFYDGGFGNITIRHNWVSMGGAYVAGAIVLINDYPGSHVTVDSNYMQGNNGGDFLGGAFSTKGVSFDHIVVTNNALSPLCTLQAYGFAPNTVGNVWSNNYNSDTHAAIGAPQVD